MPATRSALPEDLLDAIEAGATVVTHTQRAAHWLKLHYANHAVGQGRHAWATPAIYSFDAFVQQLWRVHGQRAHRVLSTVQSRLLWERVVSASSWSSELLSPQAAANTAYRSWERLQQWRIERHDLASANFATEEARALLDWNDRFAEICEQQAWLPSALLARRVVDLNLAVPAQLVVLGDDWVPSERTVLEHLATLGAKLDPLQSRVRQRRQQVARCESQEHEVAAAAEWARQQLLAGATSIGIVLPELKDRLATVRRVFSEVFAQETRVFAESQPLGNLVRADFSIAGYHRLTDFPIVQAALDLLLIAAGNADAGMIGGFLRNPFLRAGIEEAAQRALADLSVRAAGRERFDLGAIERLISVHGCAVLADCVRETHRLLLARPIRATGSSWAECFATVWRTLGWPGDATPSSDEQQVIARLYTSLGEFGALDEFLGPLSLAQAAREFEQFLRSTNYEPRSLPAPITIVDTLSVEGLLFESAWIGGMDSRHWPPPALPDPFIPIELQVRAGMPFASAALARETAHVRFRHLQAIATESVMSWASQDQDLVVAPSPWLPTDEITDAKTLSPGYAARSFATKPILEVLEEQHAPALADSRARGGARIFELQSRCPFRAFAELRLEAQALEEISSRIDARDRGMLVHAALADLWQTLRGSAGLIEKSPAQLEVMVRTTLARHAAKMYEGAAPHKVRLLQIEQDLAAERMLALFELDRQRIPFRVVGQPETKEQVSVEALTFDLRLDRVDELLDDSQGRARIIVDYKTGGTGGTQSWLRSRPEQPQLPLYAVTHPQALAAVAFAGVSARSVEYQGLARDKDLLPGVKAFNDRNLPPPHAGWTGLLDYWRGVIGRLANEYRAGDARVDPLPTACRDCHLLTLCRLNEQLREGMELADEESE